MRFCVTFARDKTLKRVTTTTIRLSLYRSFRFSIGITIHQQQSKHSSSLLYLPEAPCGSHFVRSKRDNNTTSYYFTVLIHAHKSRAIADWKENANNFLSLLSLTATPWRLAVPLKTPTKWASLPPSPTPTV